MIICTLCPWKGTHPGNRVISDVVPDVVVELREDFCWILDFLELLKAAKVWLRVLKSCKRLEIPCMDPIPAGGSNSAGQSHEQQLAAALGETDHVVGSGFGWAWTVLICSHRTKLSLPDIQDSSSELTSAFTTPSPGYGSDQLLLSVEQLV